MWRYYDTSSPTGTWSSVAQQLDWIRKTGCNAVRVFLSFPAWLYYRGQPGPNEFIRRWTHFIGLCYARGIYVMPVLWDDVTVSSPPIDPDYTDPIGLLAPPGTQSNVTYWHRNPGWAEMQEILQQDVPFQDSLAGIYIQECIAAFQGQEAALLMWDAMNEPFPDANHLLWVQDTLAAIKHFAPAHKTTWSYRVSDRFPESVTLAQDANCDVLALHAYGHTRATLESMLYDATYVTPAQVFPTSPLGKPVICTEIGYPGKGMSYQDTIGYCKGVPRPDLSLTSPATESGIGFMTWNFMIGPGHPFPVGTGMFYGDGQVRELDVVMQFVARAIEQGVSSASLWSSGQLVPKAPGSPGYIDPASLGNVGPDLDDYATLFTLVTAELWFWQAPGWTWESYLETSKLLRHVSGQATLDVAAYASQQNGNPVTAVPPPEGHKAYDPILLTYEAQSLFDPSPGSPFLTMLAGLETARNLAPGTLRPWDPNYAFQQQSVAILVEDFLRLYAQALNSYIVPRGGPY